MSYAVNALCLNYEKTPMTIPNKMTAVLLTGHGGFEKLDYRHDVGVPSPKDDEVLIKVNALSLIHI